LLTAAERGRDAEELLPPLYTEGGIGGHWMKVLQLPAAALALMATVACSDTPTSPTSTNTTPATTVAEPTTTEEFAGTLGVGQSAFYSYTIVENGTVRATLTRMGGSSVPSTVWLGLGIGQPSGEDCATTTTINSAAASSAQLTGNGVRFFSFTIRETSTASFMLASVTSPINGAALPVPLGLGTGVPAGTGWAVSESIETSAALQTQHARAFSPGIYCVALWDIGRLTSEVNFAMRFTHQ
jgi:hypothetical protein